LATSTARAVLPTDYSMADVVSNIQSVALLGLAFAQGRADLLPIAMRDRVHQPYRAEICQLLPRLLPLAGKHGILGAALSGAGPAMLVIVESEAKLEDASAAIRRELEGLPEHELLVSSFERNGFGQSIESQTYS
jgi:homoserine kinase